MKIRYEWDKSKGPLLFFQHKQIKICFCFCHRKEERTIKIFGLKLLCSRCLGMLIGLFLGIILFKLGFITNYIIAILLMIPLVIDGLTQNMGYRISNNFLRMSTGILFSVGLYQLINIIIN